MLTADLVMAWKKGNRLLVRELTDRSRQAALEIARVYIDIAQNNLGSARSAIDELCANVPVHVQDKKLAAGLLKLIRDRSTFEQPAELDFPALRAAVFKLASETRKAAVSAKAFDKSEIFKTVEKQFGVSKDDIQRYLFADLKEANVLVSFDDISSERLVALYQKSQRQAVLLKATKVVAKIKTGDVNGYRYFFNKLKFLGLLHVIQPKVKGGYKITIDGPFSLFSAGTKYGLKLALLLPALESCDYWQLKAEVLWGKDKQPLSYHLSGSNSGPQVTDKTREPGPGLSEDVAKFVERFNKQKGSWHLSQAGDILELPGMGLCVPDLHFVHQTTGEVVYFEIMGFWSRDAVWKRVELVAAGLPYKIIFAVSSRLRVSEAVLDSDLPGALYVYKGVMNPAKVAKLLDENYG